MNGLTFHLDNYDRVDVIYTDYEKTFNKVLHNRLLFKLKNMAYVMLL